jgi:signal peptidase I
MGHPRKGAGWFAGFLVLYGAFVGSIATGTLGLTFPFFGLLVCLRIAAILDATRLTVPALVPRNVTLTLMVIGMSVASFIAGIVGTQFARTYQMLTPAMYPSLEVGDRFMSSRIVRKPERGQIIVFSYPLNRRISSVQRVVGLPGDTIEMRHGELILNGSLVDRRPLSDSCKTLGMECTVWQETIDGSVYKIAIVKEEYLVDPASREFGPATVPNGQLFILGDNRDNSADSRYWGYLPIEFIEAKPKFIYWSSGDGHIRWNRIAKSVK